MNVPDFIFLPLHQISILSISHIHILFFFWLTWYPILIDIKYFVTICFNDAISV